MLRPRLLLGHKPPASALEIRVRCTILLRLPRLLRPWPPKLYTRPLAKTRPFHYNGGCFPRSLMMKKYLPAALAALLLAACQSSGSPPAQTDALPSGEWQIVRIDDTPVSTGNYTLNLNPQTMAVYFGCNRILAPYRQHGEQLEIGHTASTQMYCGADADEARGLNALEHSSRWRLEGAKTAGGQRLTFFDNAGRPRLEMQSR